MGELHAAGTTGDPSGPPAPRHVLVVDDDELILEVAVMSLRLVGGWEVSTASGGQQAIDAVRRQRPDAVVMDLMMPGMDGATAARLLREDPATRDVPVVLLTARAGLPEPSMVDMLGIVGMLRKPFDPMELPGQVAALLGWST